MRISAGKRLSFAMARGIRESSSVAQAKALGVLSNGLRELGLSDAAGRPTFDHVLAERAGTSTLSSLRTEANMTAKAKVLGVPSLLDRIEAIRCTRRRAHSSQRADLYLPNLTESAW